MASIYDDKPLDFSRIRTRSLTGRAAKVTTEQFGRAYATGEGFAGWLDSLPRILAGNSLRELVQAVAAARKAGKPVVWALGGHVIKCGLAPVLLAMMQDGFVTAVAMNGSAALHDSEIALCDATSEEVDDVLADGSFGTAEETAQLLNAAARAASAQGLGLGEALGRELCSSQGAAAPAGRAHHPFSLLYGAYQARVPVTVHVAFGTDTPHYHPGLDAAALGVATHNDFRLLCELVRQLEGGGVFLNVGSAVMLPEVFLKAVSAVRNLGHPLAHFYTANLDFIQHYRPNLNVVRRPTAAGGKGWSITGHHEITIPLIAALLKERCWE